jgi:threonine/homoserine/homoserine lactone efflux protein
MKCSVGVALPISFGWHGTDDDGLDTAFFMRGLITNLLNPKAMVFYVAVLPTFVDPTTPVLAQTVILSVVYVLIATSIHVVIVSLAGAARPFLENPDRRRIVRRILSVALAAIAVWFAFSTALKPK